MTITKLGDFGAGYSAPLSSGAPASVSLTVPAAGIPVDATCLIFGFLYQNTVASVSDSKGNTWTLRRNVAGPTIFLAECQVTASLVSGDVVTVNFSAAGNYTAFTGAWFDKCAYVDAAPGVWSSGLTGQPGGTKGGVVTTTQPNCLLLGVFGANVYAGAGTMPATVPQITTPGTGYTNQTGGGGRLDLGGGEWKTIGSDWEYKIAGAAGPETADCASDFFAPGVGSWTRAGLTVVYGPPLTTIMGVV